MVPRTKDPGDAIGDPGIGVLDDEQSVAERFGQHDLTARRAIALDGLAVNADADLRLRLVHFKLGRVVPSPGRFPRERPSRPG
jgi:hypothetical protein